jgi:hypothetical protein
MTPLERRPWRARLRLWIDRRRSTRNAVERHEATLAALERAVERSRWA